LFSHFVQHSLPVQTILFRHSVPVQSFCSAQPSRSDNLFQAQLTCSVILFRHSLLVLCSDSHLVQATNYLFSHFVQIHPSYSDIHLVQTDPLLR